MKLEQQVCSLESSKKLKELGIKRDSLWYWHKQELWATTNETVCLEWKLCVPDKKRNFGEYISAFTVAELGEMLPFSIRVDTNKYDLRIDSSGGIGYFAEGIDWNITITEKTEADARAKILIYLLENKLMEK